MNSSTFNVCIFLHTQHGPKCLLTFFGVYCGGFCLGWVSCLWRDWGLVAYNIILQINCVSSFNITFNSNLSWNLSSWMRVCATSLLEVWSLCGHCVLAWIEIIRCITWQGRNIVYINKYISMFPNACMVCTYPLVYVSFLAIRESFFILSSQLNLIIDLSRSNSLFNSNLEHFANDFMGQFPPCNG